MIRFPARTALLTAVCVLTVSGAHAHGDHKHKHKDKQPKAEAQHAQHAHVHGVAHLDIAADGKELVAQLKLSAHDVLGFEHEPRSEQEKAKVAQARTTLQQAVLSANAEAACKLEKAEVEIENDGHDDHDHDHDDKHDHDHDDDKHAHSDIEVEYHFECEKPEALKSFEVTLGKRFESVHTIEVQLALPKGQFSRTLKKDQTQLSW